LVSDYRKGIKPTSGKGCEKLSDYYVRFIPEVINTSLNEHEIGLIERLHWGVSIPKSIFSDRILLADAGQNFETVKCPFCKASLMEWWGSAMSSAYSEDYGFQELIITAPCCNNVTSLHNLEYNFPQGFYRTMIEVMPEVNSQIRADEIADKLLEITGINWRIVHARY